MHQRARPTAVGLTLLVLLALGFVGWSGAPAITAAAAMSGSDDGTPILNGTDRLGTGSYTATVNVTYGGSDGDTFRWVVPTDDGGYALVGYTESYSDGGDDFWLVKVTADGTEVWNRSYGGPENDSAHRAVQTPDGGFLLSGTTDSYGAGQGDLWLVKVTANGTEAWNRTYGGTRDDFWAEVVPAGDGDYALLGVTQSFGAGGSDFWLVKVTANGTEVWNRTYGGEFGDPAFDIARTSDGGFILAGNTLSFNPGGDRDAWLVKVTADGTEEWNRSYGRGATDIAFRVLQTPDGGYALTGTSGLGSLRVGWLRTVNATGAESWRQAFGGESDAIYDPAGLVQQADGGYAYVMANQTYGEETGWSPDTASLVLVDASGVVEATPTFDGRGDDVLLSINRTDDGTYAMVGGTGPADDGDADGWLLVAEPATAMVTTTATARGEGTEPGTTTTADAVDPDGDRPTDDGDADQGMEPTEPDDTEAVDTDGDGLTDAREHELGSDPTQADSDDDGLTDFEEVETYDTHWGYRDTDRDGFLDGIEVVQGTDPTDPDDFPSSDNDGEAQGSGNE